MLEVKIQDSCILCNKKFWWHEVTIWKLPEWVFFCLDCSEKYEDNTEYKWVDSWVVQEYEPW